MKRNLLSVFFAFLFFQVSAQTDSIKLFKVTISDSCALCSGAEERFYIDTTLVYAEEINSIIGQGDSYSLLDQKLGPEDCIGGYTQTNVRLNKSGILSFEYEFESSCGTSVSSPHQFNYLTIDVINRKKLEIMETLDSSKIESFQSFVMWYARANKVDNIPYLADTIHQQKLIEYKQGIDGRFYLTESSLGIYTKVFDNNANDWYHRSDSEVVGEEWVLVNIPYKLIRKYFKKDSPIIRVIK